ncbi:DUF2254 domain-containing protein [Desertimonas flava]|jgi:uncharacterized membrane protein|uniref:DUF2254 domain-containing protein n=1 Tax=Desertimonas flava TaxID=2064846 RepID=UPI000E3495FF|nr:DUF2254 domain-containing protein [Desertimonas flava]
MPELNLKQAGSRLWFIPVMCVLAGVVISLSTIAVDRAGEFEVLPRWLTGGPDAAVGVLTTIAASMVSLAALVLTITMVVVQLAMGQFSPRIVQTFLKDKPSQLAIGLFVATFAHAMLALREVSTDGDGQVPGVAIATAYVLVLVSIAMLVIYVNHIGRSLRVSSLIELVGDDVRRLIDQEYPPQESATEPDTDLILVEESAVITAIDIDRLVALAEDAGCVIHLTAGVGTFLPAGSVLARVSGDSTALDRDELRSALRADLERTQREDVAYGFRMLVDVAERSLSDSPFLDPTTAVQSIDRLHDGMRQLAVRDLGDGTYRDRHGVIRLTVPTMSWDGYVHLAFDEIRLAGWASPQVSRRLVAALIDLIDVAPDDRRPALREQLDLLREAVQGSSRAEADRRFALEADMQGIGSGTASGGISN